MPPNQVTPPDAAAKRTRPVDHSWVQVVWSPRRAAVVGGAGEFQQRTSAPFSVDRNRGARA